jgi:hypothetical protein
LLENNMLVIQVIVGMVVEEILYLVEVFLVDYFSKI